MKKMKRTLVPRCPGSGLALIPLAAVTDDYFDISKNLDIFAELYKK